MIDEYPILSIAAAHAKTASKFKGLKELKVKESNRLIAISNNLNKFGAKCKLNDNEIIVNPIKNKKNKIIVIDSKKDHRIAMSFIIMGMLSEKGVIVKGCEYINTSFPNFIKEIKKIGANIS